MVKRHLTAAEIDHVAQRAHLEPQRRAALATARSPPTRPPPSSPTLVDIECTLTAVASHLGPPRVSELHRHGAGGAADTEAR